MSISSSIAEAWTRFSATFWTGFEQAKAQSGARAHEARLDAGHPFFKSEAIKAALIDVVKGAYADGEAAERKRVTEILHAPGAKTFPDIAVDLVLGPATSAQAAGVLERASADAATRAGAFKSNLLERASADAPTLH